MKKNREELNKVVNEMVEILGIEKTLDEIVKAQSTDELEKNLEYINHMWELHLM